MTCVVSVHDLRGRVAGTGVLVGQDLVLTCAHVVNDAMGRPIDDNSRPNADLEVEIRFAASPGLKLRANINSHI